MELTWYVADFLTGDVIAELPLSSDSPVERRIATETSTTLSLPTADDNCPEDWHEYLVPGKTLLVLDLDGSPVQGWALNDDLQFGAPVVTTSAQSLETCLTRTNVPDYEPDESTDLAEVAASVALPLVDNFGITIEWTPCGKTNPDLSPYDNTADQTILAALNDLSAATGGPEWRIQPRWTDPSTKTRFDKVLQIGPKIGDDLPDAVFELDADGGGNIETYQRNVSFAAGKGATEVIGVSEGSGSSRPMTDPQESTLLARGWPRWSERTSFTNLDSSNGLDPDYDEDTALLSRARATLAQRELGGVTWQVTGSADAPMPGRDFTEGDTVHIAVSPQGAADPVGGTADVRVLGWLLDTSTLRCTPLFRDDSTDDGTGDS